MEGLAKLDFQKLLVNISVKLMILITKRWYLSNNKKINLVLINNFKISTNKSLFFKH